MGKNSDCPSFPFYFIKSSYETKNRCAPKTIFFFKKNTSINMCWIIKIRQTRGKVHKEKETASDRWMTNSSEIFIVFSNNEEMSEIDDCFFLKFSVMYRKPQEQVPELKQGLPMASRRGQILLGVFYSMRVLPMRLATVSTQGLCCIQNLNVTQKSLDYIGFGIIFDHFLYSVVSLLAGSVSGTSQFRPLGTSPTRKTVAHLAARQVNL